MAERGAKPKAAKPAAKGGRCKVTAKTAAPPRTKKAAAKEAAGAKSRLKAAKQKSAALKKTRAPKGKAAPAAPSPPEPKAPPRPVPPAASEILGHVAWLMINSPTHKHLFLADMEWLVLPPVLLKQFRIFRRRRVPVAYVSWAFLNDEAAVRLRGGARRLRPGDWKSGEDLWLIDVVAPFGGAEALVKELKEKVFAGRTVKTLQPAAGGGGTAVVEW